MNMLSPDFSCMQAISEPVTSTTLSKTDSNCRLVAGERRVGHRLS
jgi:hypothetical protein